MDDELPERIDDPHRLMATIFAGLKVSRERGAWLLSQFDEALSSVCKKRMDVAGAGFVEKDPAAERFLKGFVSALVSPKSVYEVGESFNGVYGRILKGENTILAPHHASPIDRHIIFSMLNHLNPNILDRTVFVIDTYGQHPATHVLQRGVNTLQVRSAATVDHAVKASERSNHRQQNIRAIRELIGKAKAGGWLLVVFPEGATHPDFLGPPSAGSGEIFEAVHRFSPAGSSPAMFPAYADGSRISMPFEGLIYSRNIRIEESAPYVKVGEPVLLADLVPEGSDNQLRRQRIGDNVMLEIARIMPAGSRGVYGMYFR